MQHSQPPDMKSKYISMHSKEKIPNESDSGVKEFIPSTFATAFPTSPIAETVLNPCNASKNVSRACDNKHEVSFYLFPNTSVFFMLPYFYRSSRVFLN